VSSISLLPTLRNYNVVNGTTVQITVNKAALTAKADDKAKIYNQPKNPPLTITYTGFVNGDNYRYHGPYRKYRSTDVKALWQLPDNLSGDQL